MIILEKVVEDIGYKEYYTVDIDKGSLVDIMCLYNDNGNLDTAFVMQCSDGGTVYTLDSDGNSVGSLKDYGLFEEDLITFVCSCIGIFETM